MRSFVSEDDTGVSVIHGRILHFNKSGLCDLGVPLFNEIKNQYKEAYFFLKTLLIHITNGFQQNSFIAQGEDSYSHNKNEGIILRTN